jgi:hypothetical protein
MMAYVVTSGIDRDKMRGMIMMRYIRSAVASWAAARKSNLGKTQGEIWTGMPNKIRWFYFFLFGAMTGLLTPVVSEAFPLLIDATDRASASDLLSPQGILAWSCFAIFAASAAWSGFNFWGVTRLLQKYHFGV